MRAGNPMSRVPSVVASPRSVGTHIEPRRGRGLALPVPLPSALLIQQFSFFLLSLLLLMQHRLIKLSHVVVEHLELVSNLLETLRPNIDLGIGPLQTIFLVEKEENRWYPSSCKAGKTLHAETKQSRGGHRHNK